MNRTASDKAEFKAHMRRSRRNAPVFVIVNDLIHMFTRKPYDYYDN